VYLIENHDLFHHDHGYARLKETIVIFVDDTSRTLVLGSLVSYIGEYFVIYFGHHMLFRPHTLGGICYNPKFLYTCIPGLWPSYLHFFPSHY
jgi:hypothetical protein